MAWTDDFASWAHAGLAGREEVREALWTRGASDAQIDLFRVGYIEGKLPEGLVPQAFHDHLWGGRRVLHHYVFPLTDLAGSCRGFQFRSVVRGERTFCDYMVDKVGPDVFGAAQAAEALFESEEVWLVEGPFDLFPVQRVYPNTIATLTARMTLSMGRAMQRLVRLVHLVYDNDPPGRQAASRVAADHDGRFEVRDHRLPALPIPGKIRADGSLDVTKDPGDLWELWGDARCVPYFQSLRDR